MSILNTAIGAVDKYFRPEGKLDLSRVAGAAGLAGLAYGAINPDSKIGQFIGAGGAERGPIGYTGGIPEFGINRTLRPDAFLNYPDKDVSTFVNKTYGQYGGPGAAANKEIAKAMNQYGVLPDQVARVTGFTPEEVEADYRAFGYGTPATEPAVIGQRRPGSAGRRYFTDTTFTPTGETMAAERISPVNMPVTTKAPVAPETQEQRIAKAQGIINSLPPEVVEQLLSGMFSGLGISSSGTGTTGTGTTGTGTTGTGTAGTGTTGTGTTGTGNTAGTGTTGTGTTNTGTTGAAAPTPAGFSASQNLLYQHMLTQPGSGSEQEIRDYVKALNDYQALATLNPMRDPSDTTRYESGYDTVNYLANKYNVTGPISMGGGVFAPERQQYAQGGSIPAPQSRGYYLGGTTDGMADQIPATINGTQQAALSDGEFVVPADVVSHLGNGNSDAGAKQLYSMMDRVRQARTGRQEQGRKIAPNKFIPV